jgi:hypothetical protein
MRSTAVFRDVKQLVLDLLQPEHMYVYLDLGEVFRPAVNYSILISCDDESYIFFNFIW